MAAPSPPGRLATPSPRRPARAGGRERGGRRTLHALVRWVHLVLALATGALLALAGITGSVLVWRHEIDRWQHPGLLVVEPAGEPLPLQRLVELVAADPATPPLRLQLPRSPEESLEITTAGEHPLQVYVDPYRGSILGSRRADETLGNVLFELHTSLLSGEGGEWVMGAAAVGLVLLVASGLVVWWPGMVRLREAVRVKWRAGWKRVNFDLHRAVGFWSTLFLLLTAVTGASLVFHDAFMLTLNRITASSPRPIAPVIRPVAGVPPLPLDRVIAAANRAVPAGEVTYVTLPASATAPVTVRKKVPEELHPNGRNFIYLHPQTGEVLALERALRAPAGTRAYNLLYPLHIGRWGGVPSRLLYTLLGLSPALLLASGLLMWRNRARRAPRARA